MRVWNLVPVFALCFVGGASAFITSSSPLLGSARALSARACGYKAPVPAHRQQPLHLRMVAVAEKDDDESDLPEIIVEERPWPEKSDRVLDYELAPGEIAVRFINSPGRYPSDGTNDIIAAAKPGDVLLAIGDSVGISLPRGCQTGLCGACACDLEDPAFPNSRSPLRACSTKVVLPADCDEFVVDVYRMINNKGKAKQDPMARFNKLDDPNEGFKARWNLPEAGKASAADCSICGASAVNPKGMMPEDCELAPGCPFGR